MAAYNSKKTSSRGFASMEPEQRRELAKKGGNARRTKHAGDHVEETSGLSAQRGFAAMDVTKRKALASKGGRTRRRNRIDWKHQPVIL
jgi:general stress protein YciG